MASASRAAAWRAVEKLGAAAWLAAGLLPGALAVPPVAPAVSPAMLAASHQAPMLAMPLGPRTRLIYEPRRLPPPNAFADAQPTPPSLGLEFKGPDANQGPRGLLRVQLSGTSAVQFRPRRSGLAVSYRAEF